MGKKAIAYLVSAEGYDRAADVYDRTEKFLATFEQGKLIPLLGDVLEKDILDVGAGTGRIAIPLARLGARVTALDVSSAMLKQLKRKQPGIDTFVADAECLPFPDASFDMVIGAFLIVHLKNPHFFFAEAYRVLKPGGRLLITNIHQKDPPELKTASGSIKIVSYYHRPPEIRGLLEELAFSIENELFIYERETWINQIILART